MFEQLSKPLKMDGIQISLLDVACLNSMQNVEVKKCGKMITHFFWFITVSLNEEIQHFYHFFQFDFEGEMCCLVPLCVHKKECA
jgi:hypothetical protein